MSLRGLLFDFDGTLAETERDGHRVAYNRAFADLGLAWKWDTELYGDLLAIAGGYERILHYVAQADPPRPRGDPRELARRIHARKAERFAELADGIGLRPGVARLVEQARAQDVLLGIVTTARVDGVRAVLGRAPATFAAFAFVVSGDDVARKKPAPDAYLGALARADIAARECIAIEDSALGLKAARAADIATLVTTSAYSVHERFDGAAAVLDGLGDASAPARVLAGPPLAAGIVTLDYLRTLMT